jgi:hypothetical protein
MSVDGIELTQEDAAPAQVADLLVGEVEDGQADAPDGERRFLGTGQEVPDAGTRCGRDRSSRIRGDRPGSWLTPEPPVEAPEAVQVRG